MKLGTQVIDDEGREAMVCRLYSSFGCPMVSLFYSNGTRREFKAAEIRTRKSVLLSQAGRRRRLSDLSAEDRELFQERARRLGLPVSEVLRLWPR